MKKFWKWKNQAQTETMPEARTLFLNGTIAEESWFDDDVTPQLFKDELNAGSGDITVWINSPGGDCVAAAAMLSWLVIEKIKTGKPSLVGASTGLVIGLVAITPGAGFVPIWAAIIIGILVSPICYFFITVIKSKFGYDDALDVFGCHGIGGIWGGIATGLLAQKSINPAAQWDGLVFGETKLIIAQLEAIGITIAIAVAGTFLIYGITTLCTKGVKVSKKDEDLGLDQSEHGESAYPAFNGLD